MRKLLCFLSIAALMCTISACGATSKGGTQNLKGTSVTEMEKRFQVGVTTKADVEQWLGTPTGIEKGKGGDTWKYKLTDSQSSVRPESFLPVIGGLVGGSDHKTEYRELNIKFNTKDVLESYSFDSHDVSGRN